MFLRKMGIVSKELIVIGTLFRIVCAATEKARLPILSIVLGTPSCLKKDDLRVLEISNKCSILLCKLVFNIISSNVERMMFHYKPGD